MLKRIVTLLGMTRLLSMVILCIAWVASGAPEKATANSTNRLEITGMTCDVCVKSVSSKLRRVSGVVDAKVTLTNNLAIVAIDTNRVSTKTLIKTIEDAGYTAKSKP